MISEKLSYVVQLIKSGNKQAALPILKEIIQSNPKDEDAWMVLYSCVDNIEQKKYCLQKVLEINSGNQDARNALKKFNDLPSQSIRLTSPSTATPPQAANKSINRKNSRWYFAIGGGCVLILLFIIPFLYLVQTGQISLLAANQPPLQSPTSTLSPTSAFTPRPSPTFTATSTLHPSPTIKSVSDSLSPTPTIVPFTPGNPTATPLGSDITDPNFIKGVAADKVDHNEEVIALMSAVIETNPELAPPYRYRGMAYWSLGDCMSGLADEEKALSINPDYAVAWADRGLIHKCLGDETQELRDFQKALSLDPTLAFVHFNLGVYYYGKGSFEKSLAEYSLSAAIDPTRSDAWDGKSEALWKLGRYEECVTNASKAIEVNEKEWLAYIDRGGCELNLGNFTDAFKDYKVFVANNPDDPMGWYGLGVAYGYRGDAYFDSGKYYEAIADYKEAVKLIPGDAHSYCRLAHSYFETKQYQNTLDAARSSIAIDSACVGQGLLEIEARSSYALGEYDQAIQYMDQALAKGSYPLGYYYRGISYQAVGRNEDAIKDLKYFLTFTYTGKEVDDAKARLAKLEP